ncbi:MAG: ferritin family protein, partial [Bacteroidota bacterium]
MLPKELTALEVLGVAIRAEVDAQDMYREMAQRISNPRAKERFYLLVAEETQHQHLLEHKYKEMFPDVPLRLPPSQLPSHVATAELRKDLSLREALAVAIQEERRVRDHYLESVPHVEDLTGKSMHPNYYEDVAEPWREE